MLSPTENAMVAYAILEQVDADREGGVDPTYLALDIARAQVYATLATVPVKPATHEDIKRVLDLAVNREGMELTPGALQAAANAVEAIL